MLQQWQKSLQPQIVEVINTSAEAKTETDDDRQLRRKKIRTNQIIFNDPHMGEIPLTSNYLII